MEICAGCRVRANNEHPWIGVGHVLSKRASKVKAGEKMETHPVCVECFIDPSHRKVKLKMHFFPRHEREQALAAAEASKGRPAGAPTGVG